jgi:hypothetical protein
MKQATITMGPTMCNPEAINDINVLRRELDRANVTMLSQSSELHEVKRYAHSQSRLLKILVELHEAGHDDGVRTVLTSFAKELAQAKGLMQLMDLALATQGIPAPQHQRTNSDPDSALAALDSDRLNHLAHKDHCVIGFVNDVDASAGTIEKVEFIFENLTGAAPTEAIRAGLDLSMLVDRKQKNGSLH